MTNTKTIMKATFTILILLTSFYKVTGQLYFQNNTSKIVYVALNQVEDAKWFVTGWYSIPPGETALMSSVLKNRYCYFYAFSDDKEWTGEDATGWIVSDDKFKTNSSLDYSKNPKCKKMGFKLIDTGGKGKYTEILDIRSDFIIAMDDYLKTTKLDLMEGLYTVSDEISIEYNSIFYKDEKKKIDHWAKVGIIKDTVNLTRNYVQYFIEGKGYQEGEVIGEYLQTKQSPTLFISKQMNEGGKGISNVMLEFIPDEYKLTTQFEYKRNDVTYKVRRTYMKYYPKN